MEEHYDLFTKKRPIDKSVLFYKNKKNNQLDYVVEYFRFEERERRGFSSVYLHGNPFKEHYIRFVRSLAKKYSHLQEDEARSKILLELEMKHSEI